MQDFRPIIIIGAARSGTNILRDVLTRIPGYATWPCDEINAIWRHGNTRHASDELPPELARPPVRRSIRRAFADVARSRGATSVVEKTCANSLRVPFVDAVLPDAVYVLLVRDGRDVVASAVERWRASADLGYMLRKARFVPPADVPYYALRFARNRAYRLLGGKGRVRTWGPRFEGIDRMLSERSLEEVCAAQWARSVELSERASASLPRGRVHKLHYEDFVGHPAKEVERLGAFLGVQASLDGVAKDVRPSSVGRWRKALSPEVQARIEPVLRPVLQRQGYG